MIAELVPNKPDKEVAEELKQEVVKALTPVCDVLDKAIKAGFIVNFQIGPGALGKQVITSLILAKHF